MTMTRQHFVLIADSIANTELPFAMSEGDATHIRELFAREMAAKLRATNPAFNRERFLRACGVEG